MAVYQVPLQEAIRVTGATCSAVGLYQRLGRLRKRNARLEEDSARGFDLQRQQQASVCAQEVETEHASVRVQEADETDCPKTSSGLNDLPTSLYEGRISPEPIRDPVTMKLLSGPLIVKTDAGPGRLSKQAISMMTGIRS